MGRRADDSPAPRRGRPRTPIAHPPGSDAFRPRSARREPCRNTAAGCAASLGSGVAHAETTGTPSLYAPSALVLTVGKGTDAATAGVQRATVLNCAPKPGGSHPAADRACAELTSVGGEFQQLVTAEGTEALCTGNWDPVLVTADGVWEGRRVSWQHTFANSCALEKSGRSLFAF
ncbi:subtilisin inhibitor-like [Streptomyces sp. Amel2xB2]|uniref:subtilase-type protease inhibitor n=1 Tax=Streptomyces sp. Amel2xB2 TaxID=1305829 RepID=UPI000DBF7403|nr:subtilase-type protease inhibitor [Streptomyces sp. Amel2xB2]RAJ68874.1 subtilisin inhibitor-like [Streptomyces sp. Amel2xB2]